MAAKKQVFRNMNFTDHHQALIDAGFIAFKQYHRYFRQFSENPKFGYKMGDMIAFTDYCGEIGQEIIKDDNGNIIDVITERYDNLVYYHKMMITPEDPQAYGNSENNLEGCVIEYKSSSIVHMDVDKMAFEMAMNKLIEIPVGKTTMRTIIFG
jgi:hypothetical protein